MLSLWTVGTIIALYLGTLFLLAFWGDSRLKDSSQHPIIYSLALGIHCTSWAFFGTTTQAAEFGWAFIPTYMGIVLAMMFGFSVMLKMARLTQQYSASSLADFIGIRYQNSHWLSGSITVLCCVGVTPYIALQLDAITESIRFITVADSTLTGSIGFYVAVIIAIFALLFGTRTLSLTEKHPGLMLTIAVESIVKLLGILIVGLYVCFWMYDGVWDLFVQAAQSSAGRKVLEADSSPWVYLSHILLGICSLFILPRQFHMNFVELNGEGELRTARWLFPAYLVGMSLFVLPIAMAGNMLFEGTSVESDVYVLAIPLYQENIGLSVMAFIGGLSATTSMVIVATLALGIMISNNLVTPLWLKARLKNNPGNTMSSARVLTIRRVSVVVVLSIAYWYHTNVSQTAPLVKSGTIAIALLAQTFPILLFGLYLKQRSTLAAILAMSAGFICWLVWLLYPSVMSSYYFDPVPSDGQLGLGFVLSLLANCVVYLIVTWLKPSHANNDIPAHNSNRRVSPDFAIRIGDLMALTAKVLPDASHKKLQRQLSADSLQNKHAVASQSLVRRVENLLASQVGSPSARILLSAIAQTPKEALTELVELVEEASQSFQFNHEVLQSSVQHIEQGICVLDQNLSLLAWNDKYLEMFDYPPGYICVGKPIRELLAFNIQRGLMGSVVDAESEITKRVNYILDGSRYKYVRRQIDGRVIELNGSPLPGGGFVTTYSDITEYIQIQEALTESKEQLEDRVAKRTTELNEAKQAADKANESKTKFLAAAGHDLMQPFNAATLFASMLEQKTSGTPLYELSHGVVDSLSNAESLLSMLLDMTKLESGVMTPKPSAFAIDEVLAPLVREFTLFSQQKQVELKYVPTNTVVYSDKKLLRRIAQNLLSNAVRYTEQGKIVIGVKRSGHNTIKLCVLDTGPGIPEHQQTEIFAEFHRLAQSEHTQGLGLGLTIVERISHLLNHHVSLVSEVGRGTGFYVELPRVIGSVETKESAKSILPTRQDNQHSMLGGKTVLLLENDVSVAKAMGTLLSDWGATVVFAKSGQEASKNCPSPPDLMLIDYHLDHGENGINAVAMLREKWRRTVPGVLNTANRSDTIQEEAQQSQLLYLPKPVKPAALKRLLKQNGLARLG